VDRDTKGPHNSLAGTSQHSLVTSFEREHQKMKHLALAALVWLVQLDSAVSLRLRASTFSSRGEMGEIKLASATKGTARAKQPTRDLGMDAKVAGSYGSPSSSVRLGECQGDCSSDSDCAQGLVCVQRDSGSPLPPGCTGPSTDYGINFCAKPFSSGSSAPSSGSERAVKRKGNDGSPSSAFPLGMCEGDCDNDSECAGDLVCFTRRAYQAVPGCSGGVTDSTPTDYCVESTSLGTSGGVPSSDFILKLYWEKGASVVTFAKDNW
jgi:hypothetical protein